MKSTSQISGQRSGLGGNRGIEDYVGFVERFSKICEVGYRREGPLVQIRLPYLNSLGRKRLEPYTAVYENDSVT